MIETAPLEIKDIKFSAKAQAFLSSPRQMLINGKWVPSLSGQTFPVFNPANGQEIVQVASGEKEDIDAAVQAARKVFDDESGPWRRMIPSERGKLIWKIGDLILENLDELAELESIDNGKPISVAKVADIPLAADVVAKGGTALNPRGELYTDSNVGERLAVRNMLDELRGGGQITGGPSNFNAKDKQAFANQLDRWLTKSAG